MVGSEIDSEKINYEMKNCEKSEEWEFGRKEMVMKKIVRREMMRSVMVSIEIVHRNKRNIEKRNDKKNCM
mgnify:CR=1 FL=1